MPAPYPLTCWLSVMRRWYGKRQPPPKKPPPQHADWYTDEQPTVLYWNWRDPIFHTVVEPAQPEPPESVAQVAHGSSASVGGE
jgi:hypothetical protein